MLTFSEFPPQNENQSHEQIQIYRIAERFNSLV